MGERVIISKRLVFINSLSGIAAKVLNIGMLVWLQQYLLKRISPEEYSLYPVLASLIIFLPLLASVFTGGLARFMVEAYARDDERRVTQIVSTMFVLLLAAGTAILIIGFLFAWYVDSILTIVPERLWDARIMMSLMVSGFAINTVLAPFLVGPYIRQKFVLTNTITIGTQLLRVAILFALLFGVSTRVLWVVVAAVSAEFCGMLFTLAISRRLVPALVFQRQEIHWNLAREVTSFGGFVFLAQLADTIRTSMNPIILNKLATAMDVTCFYLGSLPLRQIQGLSQDIQRPLLPPLTAMHAAGSRDRLRNAYLRGGRYALWAVLLIVFPLIVYRRELLTLYMGETYLTAATVMGMLLLGFPLAYGNVVMSHLAHATGRMRDLALREILTHSVNLLLTLYLVGVLRMGAMGSALSTLIVISVSQPLLHWPLGRRLAGVSFYQWMRETIWIGFAPCLGGAVVWLGLLKIIKPADWLVLAACVAGGAACYLAILFSFCLQAYEKDHLRRLATKIQSYRTREYCEVRHEK